MFAIITYKTVLKREKTQMRVKKDWTEEAVDCLRDCYESTDSEMFKQSCGDDLDELADVVCSYTAFCRDTIIPYKLVKIFPNNKPWVNSSVKSNVQKKRLAFKSGSVSELHVATKELKIEICKAKQKYKTDLENKMAANNLGSAWSSMKTITGLQNQRHSNRLSLVDFKSDTEFADALNCFYSRFDTLDFSHEVQELGLKLKEKQHFQLSQNNILKVFNSTKVNKSTGPDNICGQLLKSCAKELSSIFHYIFNTSLQTQHVPKVWKDAVIVPVPKSSGPKTLNDFRPVALTSIIMKHFEKLVRLEIIQKN